MLMTNDSDGVTVVLGGAPNAPLPEKRRTRSATKTRMHGHEGAGLAYKEVRTTIALFMASTLFAKLDEDARAQFQIIVDRNYDLSGVPDATLDATIATLDDDVMKRASAEFEFVARIGNIRDLKACVGNCALCGKGDSKHAEGEDNRDKLRYDFRLGNAASGIDLWVGSNCIVNHALKVRGADTSAEARTILERSMREHIALWRQEAWRAANPTHAGIPALASKLATATHEWKYYGVFGSRENDIAVLGQSQRQINYTLYRHTRAMRTNARFYERKSFLSDAKTDEWKQARAFHASLAWMEGVLRDTANSHGEPLYKALVAAREKRARQFAAMARVPRRL